MAEFTKDVLTEKIIACCFAVHSEIGPGFPEKIYHKALTVTCDEKALQWESEKIFEVHFHKKRVGIFKCDLIIEGKVIVELKSVTGFMPVLFRNQLIAYLKASEIKTGLLVNFGNKSCEVKRISV
jgi:GxxExxY protein